MSSPTDDPPERLLQLPSCQRRRTAAGVSAVRCIVVVPARDEQAHIRDCVGALAVQTVPRDTFEVILVDDGCTDATVQIAADVAMRCNLALTVLRGPQAGTGPARRVGMDAAAARLTQLGLPRGLIATTDADSVPAVDWLARQLAHVDRGADVVAGLIELDEEGAGTLPPSVLDRRRADAARRLADVRRRDHDAGHHHFAGASIGVVADAYRRAGGIARTPALEDEMFADALRARGIPILHATDVRVRTAARVDGRARRGLAVDLAVSAWRERRRYSFGAGFDLAQLRDAKRRGGHRVCVIVPARECAGTVGEVLTRTVGTVRRAGIVDRVVVIDAGSADGTARRAAAAGAEVLQQDDVLTRFGPALGKGDAMWRALAATDGDIVAFLDADTQDPQPAHLLGLLAPLLTDPATMLVKGAFDRPLASAAGPLPNEGGRVTELMARPLLNLHFPLLAGLAQPLAGEFSARRDVLEQLPFPAGYGVEIATLIDTLTRCGLDAIAEAQLGTRQNRHQSLRSLSEMAFAVLAAVERRIDGVRSATGGQYLRPWDDGRSVRVPVLERPPLADCAPRTGAHDPSEALRSGLVW